MTTNHINYIMMTTSHIFYINNLCILLIFYRILMLLNTILNNDIFNAILIFSISFIYHVENVDILILDI